ncbi:uncharacterized protein LOC129001586 isoform X1 [Macrosteles quadrilineatus]|uniref:uncharacterized protein LOC129001586 isoform X1 n=1 Tax=Macrosteles quadrilineatus TaxID=74068 RepID=UPI0023E19516|nr:uncharacterized protein LOC129001586 isoform X1 [Macrosteles quadrilineatus]
MSQWYKRYCSYNGCSSDRSTDGGAISFFGFPKDTERCSKWITNSGREEFRFLTPHELSKKKICELHFTPSMFANKFKNSLKKHAFPINWKNSTPELIEIDDDDDEDDNLYDELNFEDDIEPVGLIVNGQEEVQELSDDDRQNEQNSGPNVIVNSVSANTEANETVDTDASKNTPRELELVNSSNVEPTEESQSASAVTSTSNITVEENSKTKTPTEKSSSKPNPSASEKTKFHNLPAQTTQSEFYYQQCPSLDETNHSYPEPPDGEMPLFVQQNSVISMAEEAANSVLSEPPTKKRKQDKEVDITAQMNDAMKYLKDITELLTTSEDEFELFGKSVALQLKKMSLCTALAVQAKIQQVLSQHRINDIKKKSAQDQEVCNVQTNGIEEDSNEEQEETNVQKRNSPELLLDCTSETSDVEN